MKPDELRRIRLLVGLNLSQLATLVGVSTGYVSHLETGRRRITPSIERRIADALNVTPELLALMAEFERERSKVAQ